MKKFVHFISVFTALRHNGADVKLRPQFTFTYANANSDFTPSYAYMRLCNQRLLRSYASLRHNGADVELRPQFAFAYANANSDFTPSYAIKKRP